MFFNGRKFFMSNSSTKRAIAIASAIIIAFIGGYLLGATNGIALNISVNHNGTIADKQQTVMPASVSFATTAQATAAPTAETPVTEAPTTKPATSVTPTTEMPTTGAQTTVLHIPASAVEAFNQATRLSSVKNIVYNREAEKAVFDPDVLNTFFSDKDVKKQNANGLQCATTISELNSSDIANSSIKDNGDAYLLTIILNNAVIPATSEPSQNGYIFFMNYGEIANATHLINEDIEFEKTGSITLSDGKIIAEIDKASGAFKTLSISLHEEYDDEVSKSIIENKIASAPAFVKSAVEKYMKSKGIERILCTLGYNIDASFAF